MGKTKGFVLFASMAVLAFAIGCGSDEPEASVTTGGATGGNATPMVAAKDVEDVLLQHCMPCHGGATPKEKLNMETVAGLLKGSEHGPMVVPGDAANSVVVHALHGTNGKKKMPPAQGKPLSEAQIKLIEDWINAGAKPS